MVGTKAVPLLIVGMLATGISNSLFMKWQDMQCVGNCDDPDPSKHIEFNQPVWQTIAMFLGEVLCLIPILYGFIIRKIREHRSGKEAVYTPLPPSDTPIDEDAPPIFHEGEFSNEDFKGSAPLLFLAPAACDICGTTLMNVGLLFTPVSIYQMTRGALVLWVGVFSVIFLRRHLYLFQWLSLITVMLGVCIVGLSGTIFKESDATGSAMASAFLPAAHPAAAGYNVPLSTEGPFGVGIFKGGNKGGEDEEIPESVTALLGVLLILFAQLFTASQFVLEEKIMSRYDVDPLLAVGMEGVFGSTTTFFGLVVAHFFYGRTPAGRGGYFDMLTGWTQMINSPPVIWSSVASAISIALFNGCGLAVTRAISATARSTIDTCRTLGIWVGSLLLGWEVLRPLSGSLQSIGFGLLVYGTLVFNAILKPPKFVRPRGRSSSRTGGDERRTRSRSRGGKKGRSGKSKSKSKRRQDPSANEEQRPSLDASGPSSSTNGERQSEEQQRQPQQESS